MVVRCCLIHVQWAVIPCKVLSRRGRGISHYLNHGMWKVGRPEEQTNVNCNTRS